MTVPRREPATETSPPRGRRIAAGGYVEAKASPAMPRVRAPFSAPKNTKNVLQALVGRFLLRVVTNSVYFPVTSSLARHAQRTPDQKQHLLKEKSL